MTILPQSNDPDGDSIDSGRLVGAVNLNNSWLPSDEYEAAERAVRRWDSAMARTVISVYRCVTATEVSVELVADAVARRP